MTKRVTLEATFEYDEEQFDDLTDERVKNMAFDTLQHNPDIVNATVEEVDGE